MTRQPPRSTLFPTRRSSDLAAAAAGARRGRTPRSRRAGRRTSSSGTGTRARGRAPLLDEIGEHTSELQSRLHLVCRLLLEKKKKNKKLTLINIQISFHNTTI